jgi:ABC-type transport system involved in multi-copper enzyme maturation permease subunit
MSTAISEEVAGRTLGVLMTTPLSSRQLVTGKFLGRLSQILLLMAASLPLLAIIRILGGVPWSFLIQGLTVTLASVIFVAAVTLFFSTLCRRAYTVVLATLIGLGVLFVVFPFAALIIVWHGVFDEFARAFSFIHPGALLYRCTDYMFSPRGRAIVTTVPLGFCAIWLLVGTLALLRSSRRLVYQVALRRAMGDPTFLTYLRRSDPGSEVVEGAMEGPAGRIRRVVGPPMIWKEMICALSRREKLAGALAIGIEIMMLFVAFTFPPIMRILGYGGTHLMYIWLFLALGVLFTISIPAAVICGERESRTWPLLLVTPLRDRDLLLGKFVGVLRRCGPVWLPLLAYVGAFTLVKGFQPVAVVHVLVIMASAIVFLSATGFYFGSRCNRTTEAVTANLVMAGVVWIVLPLLVQWAAYIFKVRWHGGEAFVGVPFVQAYLLVATTLVGEERLVRGLDAQRSTLLMLEFLVVYLLAAGMFLGSAVRAFRRRIV